MNELFPMYDEMRGIEEEMMNRIVVFDHFFLFDLLLPWHHRLLNVDSMCVCVFVCSMLLLAFQLDVMPSLGHWLHTVGAKRKKSRKRRREG